jgi:hypothetical protein
MCARFEASPKPNDGSNHLAGARAGRFADTGDAPRCARDIRELQGVAHPRRALETSNHAPAGPLQSPRSQAGNEHGGRELTRSANSRPESDPIQWFRTLRFGYGDVIDRGGADDESRTRWKRCLCRHVSLHKLRLPTQRPASSVTTPLPGVLGSLRVGRGHWRR